MTDSVITHELHFQKPFYHLEKQLLTEEAVAFLQDLVIRFAPQRDTLLAARQARQKSTMPGRYPISKWKRLPSESENGRFAVFPRIYGIVAWRLPDRLIAKW